jgi:hypothetical protein
VSGEKEQARSLLRHEEALPEFPHAEWAIICAYCELGDLDACFRWMEKGASTDVSRLDPRLAPIRRDPRFQDWLKKRKLV